MIPHDLDALLDIVRQPGFLSNGKTVVMEVGSNIPKGFEYLLMPKKDAAFIEIKMQPFYNGEPCIR